MTIEITTATVAPCTRAAVRFAFRVPFQNAEVRSAVAATRVARAFPAASRNGFRVPVRAAIRRAVRVPASIARVTARTAVAARRDAARPATFCPVPVAGVAFRTGRAAVRVPAPVVVPVFRVAVRVAVWLVETVAADDENLVAVFGANID